MCQYNCRGPGGLLVRKSTQWATSSPLLLAAVTAHCPGDHPHERLVGSATKQAAAYTPELADAILLALVELVKTYVSMCRFPLVPEAHALQRQDTRGFGAVPPPAVGQSFRLGAAPLPASLATQTTTLTMSRTSRFGSPHATAR